MTALPVEGKTLLARLFFAEGTGTPQRVRFDGKISCAELVELNGRFKERLKIASPAAGKTELSFVIPRFGIRTLKIQVAAPVPLDNP